MAPVHAGTLRMSWCTKEMGVIVRALGGSEYDSSSATCISNNTVCVLTPVIHFFSRSSVTAEVFNIRRPTLDNEIIQHGYFMKNSVLVQLRAANGKRRGLHKCLQSTNLRPLYTLCGRVQTERLKSVLCAEP